MKKTFLLFFISISSFSQNNEIAIEKSIYNFQIGAVGAWFSNETRLYDEISLKSEVGLYAEIIKGIGFFIAPEIILEPRWYYNFKKRGSKGLDVNNNSANFITLKTNFRSSLFEFSDFENKRAENSIAFIPKWGIRRNINSNFNYELGLGFGYFFYIDKKYATVSDNQGPFVDLHIRIGYSF